jgi:hypothetical protein
VYLKGGWAEVEAGIRGGQIVCVNYRDAGNRVQTTALKRARGTIDNEAKVKSGRSMLKGEHA